MKKQMIRHAVIFLVMSILLVSVTVGAESFSHAEQPGGEAVSAPARQMFAADCSVSAASLGTGYPLDGLTDLCYSSEGELYVLCGEASRLYRLNADGTFGEEIRFVYQDEVLDFTGAMGIDIGQDRLLYLSDSRNARVVIAQKDGTVKEIRELPDSPLIPKDFLYQPVTVATDHDGFLYILSLGCYYGAIEYSPEGEFIGFYGANTVKASALDTLTFLWEKLTKNETKQASSVKSMPFSFVDMALDTDGYLVTCTGSTEQKLTSGQIRKLSPGGQDILIRRKSDGSAIVSSEYNFLENETVRENGYQNLTSICVDDAGFIYALDANYGLIYVYDSECNLLDGFGGGLKLGNRLGTFMSPVALSVYGNRIAVADKDTKRITYYSLTEYGAVLKQAHRLYIEGDYIGSEELWQKVLSEDRGNQLAYRGLAMAAYGKGDYRTALRYAEDGLDYTVYDMAWQEILSESLSSAFVWILVGAVLLIAGVWIIIVRLKKREAFPTVGPKMKTYLSVMPHPFDSFNSIRQKRTGSLPIAAVLVGCLYLSFTLKKTASGFLFTDVGKADYNTLYTLAQTVGLFLLWTVSNWLMSSLFSGKGSLKEVAIGTAYSLTPLIIFQLFSTVLSHFIPLSGAYWMNAVGVAAWIFSGFLLCVAMMIIHEYDFFRFVLVTLSVLFLMIMIVFVIFLFYTLSVQVWDLIRQIYEEAVYR